GVSHSLLKQSMPLYEQHFLNEQFKVMNTIDFSLLKSKFGEETVTVERAHLHESLYEKINPHYIHFNKEVTAFKQSSKDVTLYFSDGNSIRAHYVIAADGLNSIFRRSLLPHSKARFSGYTCWRGITQNKNDVTLNVSSEAWSSKGRFGWAPLYNDRVYWFACVNARENDEYYQSLNKDGVAHLFR